MVFNAIEALGDKLEEHLTSLERKVNQIMSEAADIANAVTVVTNLLNDVSSDNQTILADITAIQDQIANGQPVDTSALDAVIAKVSNVQSGLDSAVENLSNVASPPASGTGTSTGTSSPPPAQSPVTPPPSS